MASYNTFRSVLQTGRVHGDNETFETVQVRSLGALLDRPRHIPIFPVHTETITSRTISSHLSSQCDWWYRIPPKCPYIVSFHGAFLDPERSKSVCIVISIWTVVTCKDSKCGCTLHRDTHCKHFVSNATCTWILTLVIKLIEILNLQTLCLLRRVMSRFRITALRRKSRKVRMRVQDIHGNDDLHVTRAFDDFTTPRTLTYGLWVSR